MKKTRLAMSISIIILSTVLTPLIHSEQNVSTLSNDNQVFRVDNEGDGDFTTIQHALLQAQPGDTIEIYSGTYEENIFIQTPQLTITGFNYELGSGSDSDYPIITGNNDNDVISIHTQNTLITHCIIQNSGVDFYDAGIGIYQNNNTIKANGITGNFYGITIQNCSQNTITENFIVSNVMDGLYLCSTHHNTISKNTIKDNGFQGMFLRDTTRNDIKENTIALNNKDGIQFREDCSHNTIQSNTIHSNNIDGIKCLLSNITENLIKKNTIYSNGWNGIHLLLGEHNQIIENEITLNLFNGIHIGNSDNNIISKNTIEENQEEGIMILFEESTQNKIYYNNFINDNAYDNGYNQWDNGVLGGNYWSYYSGSDENNDGLGDSPYIIAGNENQDNYPFIKKLIPPSKPQQPSGTTLGSIQQTYTFQTQATATDKVQFGWDWNGDRIIDEWTKFYNSNEPCKTNHTYTLNGTYHISVIAMDNHGFQSDWSDPLTVTMPKKTTMIDSIFFDCPVIKYIITTLIHCLTFIQS